MNDPDLDFAKSLRRHVPPVRDSRPARDLWPAMRRKIESQEVKWSRMDAVLAATAPLLCLISPQTVWILCIHL